MPVFGDRLVSMRSALLAAMLAAAAHAQQASQPPRDMLKFANASWRWSISYPAEWTVDSKDPDLVRIGSADRQALCSIHSGPMDRFNSTDELAEFMVLNDGRFFRDKGRKFAVLSRRRITLGNGIVGSEVLVEIGPGGRSRRLYVLADGRGFAVDCEGYAKSWSVLDAAYRRIMASFTVSR